MKVLLPVLLIAAALASPAHATCTAPLNDVKIPDGSKATMDEMLAAKHAIEVIHLVLDDARMKIAHGTVDGLAPLVESAIAQAPVARHQAAHARD